MAQRELTCNQLIRSQILAIQPGTDIWPFCVARCKSKMPAQTVTTYGAPTSGGGLIQPSPGAPFVYVGPGQSYQQFGPAAVLTESWANRYSNPVGRHSPGGTVTGILGSQGSGGEAGGGAPSDLLSDWQGEIDAEVVRAENGAEGNGLLTLAILAGALFLVSKL